MDLISKFYKISEMLDDDINKVAFLIHSKHKGKEYPSDILEDVEQYSEKRLAKYATAIDEILDMRKEQILEAAKGLTFADESKYIEYLKSLLDSHTISYAPLIKKTLF